MRHAGTQTLETDRLFLRRLLPQDAGMMYANWASDPEVTRFLRWEPHKNALETVGLLAAWATLYPNPDLLPVGHCGKGFRAGVWQHQHLQCSAR